MPEKRQKYDREFREGAVRIVEETGKPIAQIARDLGVNAGTLGNWVNQAKEAREGTEGLSRGDIEELKRLRAENAELKMERDWGVPRILDSRLMREDQAHGTTITSEVQSAVQG